MSSTLAADSYLAVSVEDLHGFTAGGAGSDGLEHTTHTGVKPLHPSDSNDLGWVTAVM